MIRQFTGRHMGVLITAFFVIVIAVNVTMATYASRTFGGVVVENGYVASQRFNRWLDEAERQRTMNWRASAVRDHGQVVVTLDRATAPVRGAAVRGVATHPLGRLPDRDLSFRWVGDGRYEAVQPLPPGRWRLKIEARRGSEHGQFLSELPA